MHVLASAFFIILLNEASGQLRSLVSQTSYLHSHPCMLSSLLY